MIPHHCKGMVEVSRPSLKNRVGVSLKAGFTRIRLTPCLKAPVGVKALGAAAGGN